MIVVLYEKTEQIGKIETNLDFYLFYNLLDIVSKRIFELKRVDGYKHSNVSVCFQDLSDSQLCRYW